MAVGCGDRILELLGADEYLRSVEHLRRKIDRAIEACGKVSDWPEDQESGCPGLFNEKGRAEEAFQYAQKRHWEALQNVKSACGVEVRG